MLSESFRFIVILEGIRDENEDRAEWIGGQVHIDRMPTWKNAKHGQQWINTLRDYAFLKIGRMPIDSIDQPEVVMCLAPIWTEKHETAKRVAQRIKTVLDVARSKGFRSGKNPVTANNDAQALPKVTAKPMHHKAMRCQDVPAFYTNLKNPQCDVCQCFAIYLSDRIKDQRSPWDTWTELGFDARLRTCPVERMKNGEKHRVPLTDEMLSHP